MKKIILTILSLGMFFASSTELLAIESEEPTVCTYSDGVAMKSAELVVEDFYFDYEGVSYLVTFDDTGAYIINNQEEKIMLLKVVNRGRGNDYNMSSRASDPTMREFLKDFEYISNYEYTDVEIPKIIKDSYHEVESLLMQFLLTSLGVTGMFAFGLSLGTPYAIEAIANAVLDYPGDSIIRYNIKYYRNKSCIMYLFGSTFTMEAHGTESDREFEWSWSENPTLSYVGTQCKMMSQKYYY